MSVEILSEARVVNISPDAGRGQSLKTLQELHSELITSGEVPRLALELGRVISNAAEESAESAESHEASDGERVDELLIATYHYDDGGFSQDAPSALAYAEGVDYKPGEGFSSVNVLVWINRSLEHDDDEEVSDEQIKHDALMYLLEETDDTKDFLWGIPVSKETLVRDLSNVDAYDRGVVTQTYGHIVDRNEVESLDVGSEELKESLLEVVDRHHQQD